MSELTSLTLAEARDRLRRREFSSVELADAHLVAMEKARELNAFVLETPEHARAMAAAADARLRAGDARPLEGLALGIKDMFATKDVRTTACSRILDNFLPTYESTVSSNLWRDGAVMLGKLNNDEFAMGSSNETSFFGPVISPWRRKGANTLLVPGGSSGGSAAALAAGMCLGATGTDTGGSIRIPSSLCGTVGIKPTIGRVSLAGVVPLSWSLDHAGPLTRSVEDCAIMLNAIAGSDRADPRTVDAPVPDFTAGLGRHVRGRVIGVPTSVFFDGVDPETERLVRRAIPVLES